MFPELLQLDPPPFALNTKKTFAFATFLWSLLINRLITKFRFCFANISKVNYNYDTSHWSHTKEKGKKKHVQSVQGFFGFTSAGHLLPGDEAWLVCILYVWES